MYEDHYGLSGRPFALTPDSRFWFDTATHKKAMAYLGYGLSQGEGFIVITGEIGAGKTTLVGHLTDTIDRERLNVIKIVSTQVAADDLLRTVAAGLGVDATDMTKAAMLGAIERGLHAVARSGRRTLLIVDEGQALPIDSLEELRMLSNFTAGGYAILQIFLLGQPEFREKLADPSLEQLRQRVIATHHLGAMEPHEVESYLAHRLSVVGWNGNPRFDREALNAMHGWSGGIPRRLNQLASRVLLHGSVEGIEIFTGADIDAVTADLDGDTLSRRVAPAIAAPQSEPFLDADAEAYAEPEIEPIIYETEQPFAFDDEDAEPRSEPELSFYDEDDVLELTEPAEDVVEAAVEHPDEAYEPFEDEAVVADESIVEDGPVVEAAADAPEASKTVVVDLALMRRIADIESRLEAQDAALRRVLTLLVDWVEGTGARPDLSSFG